MNQKKIIVWILAFLVVFQLVAALGLRPAKTTIIAKDTPYLEGVFWVVNDEKREFTMKIALEGEIASLVELETEELNFREDDEARPVKFKVKLPSAVPPGQSIANILVEETLENLGDGVISSKIVLKHKIIVQGDYPEKFISAKLNIHDEGEQLAFVSEVQNLGQQDLQAVQTRFYLNDRQQQPQVLETSTIPLTRKENKLLTAKMEKKRLEEGEFDVLAVTTFDDQKMEVTKTLVLGQPKIEVAYFDRYFQANKINQYSMDLLNQWNKEIKNVFVDVEIKKEGQKIDGFRTKSVDIAGWQREKIQDYFDARDRSKGKYTFDLIVNFWNMVRIEQKKQTFESEFLGEGEAERAEPLAGQATETKKTTKSHFPAKTALWVLAGLVLAALFFFTLWRYFHRERYEGGEEGAF